MERQLGIGGSSSKEGEGDKPTGAKRRFDDTEYLEQSREIVDSVKSAVTAGIFPPFPPIVLENEYFVFRSTEEKEESKDIASTKRGQVHSCGCIDCLDIYLYSTVSFSRLNYIYIDNKYSEPLPYMTLGLSDGNGSAMRSTVWTNLVSFTQPLLALPVLFT